MRISSANSGGKASPLANGFGQIGEYFVSLVGKGIFVLLTHLLPPLNYSMMVYLQMGESFVHILYPSLHLHSPPVLYSILCSSGVRNGVFTERSGGARCPDGQDPNIFQGLASTGKYSIIMFVSRALNILHTQNTLCFHRRRTP